MTREVTVAMSDAHHDIRVTVRARDRETVRQLWDTAGRMLAAADDAAGQEAADAQR